MTRRVGNKIIIEEEEPQQCDECGKVDELRPYGEDGACICFPCAMKDEEGTKARFDAMMFGDKE